MSKKKFWCELQICFSFLFLLVVLLRESRGKWKVDCRSKICWAKLHILPKLFAAYIQHKDIFWNIYIPQPCTRLTFIPPTVGMIYPIPTYILNWHIFPKLLAAYIQYKYIFQQIYIPQHCAQRAHRNSNNTCSAQVLAWYIQYPHIYSTDIYSPNFWQHMFNTNIYFNKSIFPNTAPEGRTETPTIHPAPKCWPNISNTHMCSTQGVWWVWSKAEK